ncbi:MAG: acyltransferase [Pseudomonadota bacterium]
MINLGQISGKGVTIRGGHDNFFTPLRLFFALLVVVGHAFAVSYGNAEQEPTVLFDYSFSYLAVNLFFIASGFLVTGSMLYRGDTPGFLAARILRIYPALIIHVLFILFIIGPIATLVPISDYLTSLSVWLAPFKVLTFIDTDLILPGVFATNGEPHASAPLWTLRYEVLCYIGTVLCFSMGFMRKRWMLLAQFILPSILWIVGQGQGWFDPLPASAENLCRFMIAYGLGATLFAYRDRIRFTWPALIIPFIALFIFQDTPVSEIAMNGLMAVIVMGLAYARMPKLDGLKSLSDISYGIYIYHWGVMQMIIHWIPGLGVFELFALAIGPTVLLAWLSWTYIEKPMLRHKTRFGNWLRRNETLPEKPVLAD